MGKRLRSLKWRTLTRKGFTIERAPGEPVERQRWRGWIKDGLKHPAFLIMLGFVCTGVIGKYLSDRQDNQQRQRQAVVKSMDDLRTSMDDLRTAFSDYQQRAMVLISLRESGAPSASLDSARTTYNEAFVKLQDRLMADGPNIEQRYPSAANDYSVPATLSAITMGLGFADDCIINGTLKPRAAPERGRSRQLMCTDTDKKTITAQNRLTANYLCVVLFTSKLRPDPKDDFSDDPTNNLMRTLYAQGTRKICDVQKLMGMVDFGGKDVN
jgi:hypothetical protein